jgi:hypothetical protein
MTSADWLALAGILLGGGGLTQVVAKMTRMAVAVEELVESYKVLTGQVHDHEERLSRGGL